MLSDANCAQPHHQHILEELCQAHILKAAKLFCKLQLMQAFPFPTFIQSDFCFETMHTKFMVW